jgi:mevalonate kinase
MVTTLVQSSAPGKIILLGEHAVVYGRPAIALPVTEVRATATVEPASPGSGLTLVATDIGGRFSLDSAPPHEPLAAAARITLAHLSLGEPDAILTIRSAVPIASGMGSGAAVATAFVRALSKFVGHALKQDEISQLVFEVEKIHHGTPSGVDNTVVVYEQPVIFTPGLPIERLSVAAPISLLIGDTGIRTSTRAVVEDLRRRWDQQPARYDVLFDQIGDIVGEARRAIEAGDVRDLGPLMDENQGLLMELGVSSPELNQLVDAARFAGALGAKLSGAGRGGNVIALVEEEYAPDVEGALRDSGAETVISTTVRGSADRRPRGR